MIGGLLGDGLLSGLDTPQTFPQGPYVRSIRRLCKLKYSLNLLGAFGQIQDLPDRYDPFLIPPEDDADRIVIGS